MRGHFTSLFLLLMLVLTLDAAVSAVSANSHGKVGEGHRVELDALLNSMLKNAGRDPDNWVMYSEKFLPVRYSVIKDIDMKTINNIEVKWSWTSKSFRSRNSRTLSFDGDLFVTSADGHFFRLDGLTGRTVWNYSHTLQEKKTPHSCRKAIDRDPVIYNGRLYSVTLDGHLLALDGRHRKVVWDETVAAYRNCDALSPGLLSLAAVKDMVIFGKWQGGTGIVAAHDAETGGEKWKSKIKDWPKDIWKYGGGSAWVDQQSEAIYWGIGQLPSKLPPLRHDIYIDSPLGLNFNTGSVLSSPSEDLQEGAFHLSDGEDNRKVWRYSAPHAYLYSIDDGRLQAINAWDGKSAWKVEEVGWKSYLFNSKVMSTKKGLIFLGDSGVLKAYNAENGKELWGFYTGTSSINDINTVRVENKDLITILAGPAELDDSGKNDYVMAFGL